MSNIKILDCTLRDGGYLNNWNFGRNNIKSVILGLVNSNVDIIECGFLTNKYSYDFNKTLFSDTKQVISFIPDQSNSRFALMVNMGEYDLSAVNTDFFEIRVAFKPYDTDKLADYLKPLSDKKIPFSLNSMHISLYSEEELFKLIELANELKPTAFTAVDTMGIMRESDVIRVFALIDKYLDKSIDIGFHSHDNLGLSSDNTKVLLNMDLGRTIIIDSCLCGLGRGGGMLNTNDIAIYLNDTYSLDINLSFPLGVWDYLKSIDTEDKYPYRLSAYNKCHPNYAKYLVDRGCPNKYIELFLREIPFDNRPYFNKDIIENIFLVKKNSLIFEEV